MASVIDLSAGDAAATPPERRPLVIALGWLAWLGGWSALVLAMAALVSAQKAIPLRYTLPSEALNYYTLAAISLAVWFAGARMTARQWTWPAQSAMHAALAVVLVALWQAIYGSYLRLAIGPRVFDTVFRGTWMFQVMNACVLYGGVVGGTLAVQASRRAREQERRRHELALLARDAELRALTAQLEPHFLLNTLTSVLALIETSPREARTMIERLAELLKAAFDETLDGEITLTRELELMAAYLGIQQIRFGDRLAVSVDVPESLRGVGVPPFLLQPIVENAVKHVVAASSGRTTIAIRGRRVGAQVRLEVADSGAGFDPCQTQGHGRGLPLTERRLRAFAPDGAVQVERRDGGCVVALTFSA
jgi:K+-sensing histidine kinase KdpD